MERYEWVRTASGNYMRKLEHGDWVPHSDAAAQLAAKDAEIANLTRRLALAVAEVKAWRSTHVRNRCRLLGEPCKRCDAVDATDADPVLRAMIEKGSA